LRTATSLPVIRATGAAGRFRAKRATTPSATSVFFDNRQKYLLFVNTCSEKWEVANRVSLELGNIHPRPPAVRVFDAGVGEPATVLAGA